jgi:hypothetical protein
VTDTILFLVVQGRKLFKLPKALSRYRVYRITGLVLKRGRSFFFVERLAISSFVMTSGLSATGRVRSWLTEECDAIADAADMKA